MIKPNQKAVIYARQSSGSDDRSESVEAQVENCQDLAEREKLEVVGIFRDLNTSGETYPTGAENIAVVDSAYVDWLRQQTGKKNFRSGLGDLLKLLPEIDYIIVNEMTRLYRPANGSFIEVYINNLLRTYKVKVLQVQGGMIDLSKFDQQLMTLIKNQILFDDLMKKKENSKIGRDKRRDSGLLCGRMGMYGINYLGNDKLQVDPKKAEVIKYVYDNILLYRPYRAIIKDCNEKFGKLGTFFYESSLYHMAKQPIYAGYMYDSKGELIKCKQMQGKAIVTLSKWLEVQRIIQYKRKEHHCRGGIHWLPLSSRLICGNCCGKLTCLIDHGNLFYHCNKPTLDTRMKRCRNSRIAFTHGEEKTSLYYAIYPILLLGLFVRMKRYHEKMEWQKNLKQYEDEFAALQEKQKSLLALAADDLDQAIFKDTFLKLKMKKLELFAKIQAVKSKEIEDSIPYASFAKIYREIKVKHLPNSDYEALLHDLKLTIDVCTDHITVHTICGDITLPRILQKRLRRFPEWIVEKDYDGFNEETKIKVTYLLKPDSHWPRSDKPLADFGDIVFFRR